MKGFGRQMMNLQHHANHFRAKRPTFERFWAFKRKQQLNWTTWWFQILFIFIPIPGEMIQFDEHIFVQMGWFNHQLVEIWFFRELYGTWRSCIYHHSSTRIFPWTSEVPTLTIIPSWKDKINSRKIPSSSQHLGFGGIWTQETPKPKDLSLEQVFNWKTCQVWSNQQKKWPAHHSWCLPWKSNTLKIIVLHFGWLKFPCLKDSLWWSSLFF